MMKIWKIVMLAALATVGLSACSTKSSNMKSDLGISGAPKWVNEGTRAVKDKGGRLVQGLGSAPAMDDISLQKSTADNRARAEIAKVISTFIDSSIEDYSSTTGAEVDSSIERSIRSSSQVALSGSKIMAHWKDSKSGVLYSFAELDIKKLKKAIENASSMNAGYKDYIKESLDASFDRFVGDDK